MDGEILYRRADDEGHADGDEVPKAPRVHASEQKNERRDFESGGDYSGHQIFEKVLSESLEVHMERISITKKRFFHNIISGFLFGVDGGLSQNQT